MPHHETYIIFKAEILFHCPCLVLLPEEDTEQDDDGKIKFRKPVKRQNEAKSDLQTSSSKKQKANKEKKKSTAREVKNSSLLSFDDEEDEET